MLSVVCRKKRNQPAKYSKLLYPSRPRRRRGLSGLQPLPRPSEQAIRSMCRIKIRPSYRLTISSWFGTIGRASRSRDSARCRCNRRHACNSRRRRDHARCAPELRGTGSRHMAAHNIASLSARALAAGRSSCLPRQPAIGRSAICTTLPAAIGSTRTRADSTTYRTDA
jgi:hypothetical protein